MTRIVKIKRGLDIKLKGEAERRIEQFESNTYSIQPINFRIIHPKLLVAVGDEVLIGSPLLHDKKNESIVITSPVSGKVSEIRRGEKRRLEHIIIEDNKQNQALDFGISNIETIDRKSAVEKILTSGLWPAIRQRPFNIIANPNEVPDAIFISGFDTAPLAPEMDFIVDQFSAEQFQKGIDVLKKLTGGQIHLNIHPKKATPKVFLQTKHVQINQIYGPHPASNIGVQIHHIQPIMKGDLIWHVGVQDIMAIGSLFAQGKADFTRVIACAGSELQQTFYVKTKIGACFSKLLENNTKQDNVRVISGNVLTGSNVGKDGYLGFYDNMMTVIPEGDYYEFMGWAMPGFKKFSHSRTFWSWLFKNRSYALDTNKHGEERAFVVSGEYEKVFPWKIMPVQLLKAIIVRDFELMEQLGIYEVSEEDFALCEVICTSKIQSQSIARDGIDYIIKETN
jgi:Na+-transporting NADH:ubiquinone oxidoreductase subunit A